MTECESVLVGGGAALLLLLVRVADAGGRRGHDDGVKYVSFLDLSISRADER